MMKRKPTSPHLRRRDNAEDRGGRLMPNYPALNRKVAALDGRDDLDFVGTTTVQPPGKDRTDGYIRRNSA